ncbi:hypothetical protein [Actinomadura chokoriensis]|uniref:Uncharacterized protein n=1 Tax=Actinomadura chokoriensis TaxID=454156 RepID=A0ABV4RAJ5_9ACTN
MSDEAAETPEFPVAEQAPSAGPEAPSAVPEPSAGPDAPDEPEPGFPAAAPPDPTGDPRVDAAVAGLGGLGGRSVSEHVEIYEDVHRRLQELLASADQDEPSQPSPSPQPSGPGRPAFPDSLRPRP